MICIAVSWPQGASCDAAGRVVELVHARSHVRRELGSIDAPIYHFRVRVAECARGANSGGCVERTSAVGVEGCQGHTKECQYAKMRVWGSLKILRLLILSVAPGAIVNVPCELTSGVVYESG